MKNILFKISTIYKNCLIGSIWFRSIFTCSIGTPH